MSAIFTGDGARSKGTMQADFKNAADDTTQRYIADSKPQAGPFYNAPPKRKTTASGLFTDMADSTQVKKAKPAIAGGISGSPVDVIQRWFPAGETPIPTSDKATVISKAGIPVYMYDDHAFSHGFKTQNSLTHMIVLSDQNYGHKYIDSNYMSLVIPQRIPLFNIRVKDPTFKIDPRQNVCGIGEFHRQIMDKYKGKDGIEAMEEHIDHHSFLGISLHTICEKDKRGLHVVALTFTFKGLADMANLWVDPHLERVAIGSKLWFYWALRTEGYEDQERVAQIQGGEFIPPADKAKDQYLRLEPWVQSGHGLPPLHVRRSRLYPGRPPIFIGRVVRLNRGAAGGSSASTRFSNYAKDLLYPKESSTPVTMIAKTVDRMPIITVSLSKT